jgi:hypothetical protein
MNFKEAVLSGKKIRSQYWGKGTNIDTTIFSDKMEDWIVSILCQTAMPLTWKEILGNWELDEE